MWEILQFIYFLLLGLAVIYLIGQRIVAVLRGRSHRRRKRRHAGQHESRFPYRLVGYLFLGMALLMSGWLVVQALSGTLRDTDEGKAAVTVISLVVMASVLAFRKSIQQHIPSASDVLQTTPGRPVLYLRSFEQESLKFVDLPQAERDPYNDILNYAEDVRLPGFEQNVYRLIEGIARAGTEGPADMGEVTFEKYFRAALRQHIGPLVALGNPVDELPAEGATETTRPTSTGRTFFSSGSASAPALSCSWAIRKTCNLSSPRSAPWASGPGCSSSLRPRISPRMPGCKHISRVQPWRVGRRFPPFYGTMGISSRKSTRAEGPS